MIAVRRQGAVAFAGFSAFLSLYLTQPLLPMLAAEFATSEALASMTVTAATAGVALSAPLTGAIADRLGRKRVIAGGATLLACTTAVCGLAPTLTWLLALRFLQGLFTPAVFATTVAYIQEEWAGEGTGSATARYVTGTVIGGFVGRVVSALVAEAWGWRAAFGVIGTLGAIAAVVLTIALPKERAFQRHTAAPPGTIHHLRNPQLLGTYAVGFCILFSMMGPFTWVTFHLASPPYGLNTQALGWVFVVYLFGALITPRAGRSIDRYGHRPALMAAMGVAAVGLLISLIPSTVAVMVGLALDCTGVFLAQSAASTYIGIAARHTKATAVGYYVTFYYVGGSAGAILPALVWNRGGWPACVAMFVAVQVLTAAIAHRTFRTELSSSDVLERA